jgi:hypothetical protein
MFAGTVATICLPPFDTVTFPGGKGIVSRNTCEVPGTKPKPLIVRERFAAAGANAMAGFNAVICKSLNELPSETTETVPLV